MYFIELVMYLGLGKYSSIPHGGMGPWETRAMYFIKLQITVHAIILFPSTSNYFPLSPYDTNVP